MKKNLVWVALIASMSYLLISAFSIFKSDLHERYRMFGNGTLFQTINYLNNYRLIGEVKLPSNSTHDFEFTSPINGTVAFYQLRLSDFNFTELKEVDEYCRKLFPTLTLNLDTPVLEQFYYLNKNGSIIKDDTGRPLQKKPKSVQREFDKNECVLQYKYGNIFLKIKNNKKQTLFDSKITIFRGQSVTVKKDELLYLTINTETPKNKKIAPQHHYNIYIKLKKMTLP